MTELQELALNEIAKLAKETLTGLTRISVKANTKEELIDSEKDVYPLNSKVSGIENWVEAILKEEE